MAKKKIAKKATKKKAKGKGKKKQAKLTPAQQRAVELQQQVVQATSEIVQDVQSGKIRGFVLLGITDNPDTDMLRFAGANPPPRLNYLFSLGSRINMDNAVRNINAASAAQQTAAESES